MVDWRRLRPLTTRQPRATGPTSSRSALCVVGETLPVDHHAGLVADDPGVVTGRATHVVAPPEGCFFAVVHADRHLPRDYVAHVRRHAAVRLSDGLNVLRPLPARLERCAPDTASLQIDQLKLSHAI